MARHQKTLIGRISPVTVLAIGLIMNFTLLAGLGWYSYSFYRSTRTTMERDSRIEELGGIIVHLDEVLSMSARMAAATGNSQWERRYRQYEPKLDAAIKEVMKLSPSVQSTEGVSITNKVNIKLMEMENRAFSLVRQNRSSEAKALLFGKEYETQKRINTLSLTRLAHSRRLYMKLMELRSTITYLDEVLTMSARMAVATGDLQWERRYRQNEPKLDAAIKEAMEHAPEAHSGTSAAKTDAANIKLVNMEHRAFELVREGRAGEAEAILFSNEYELQKQIYAQGMSEFAKALSAVAKASLQQHEDLASYHLAGLGLAVPLMFAGWFAVFRAARKWMVVLAETNHDLELQSAELTALNLALDQNVKERTSQLTKSNEELEAEILQRKRSQEATLNMMEDIEREVSEREQAEKSLMLSNRELTLTANRLERVNNELRDFVYVASHDLREPLRKIASFGGLLRDSLGEKLEEDDLENMDYMIDGANRMTKMIEGLLTYSRLNAGDDSFEAVDLNDIIEELERFELSTMLEETGGTIEVPQSLPPVKGNPDQIRQLLQNLFSNAIKYHRPEAAPQIVVCAVDIDDNSIRIEVRDNGIGIPEQYRKDVFKMFRRLHSRRKYQGTGIGLAVCSKIVDRHGGQIGIESIEGEGATFWFTLSIPEQAPTTSEPSVVS